MAAAGETHALTKNQKRRLKKKLEKQQQDQKAEQQPLVSAVQSESGSVKSESGHEPPPAVEVEYVSLDLKSELALPNDDPAYEEFMRIFGKFSSAEELCGHTTEEEVRLRCVVA